MYPLQWLHIFVFEMHYLQYCEALYVPESEQLSMLRIMFKHDALRLFTDCVNPTAIHITGAFQKWRGNFITPVHQEADTTK